jgi:hypothetical protein
VGDLGVHAALVEGFAAGSVVVAGVQVQGHLGGQRGEVLRWWRTGRRSPACGRWPAAPSSSNRPARRRSSSSCP